MKTISFKYLMMLIAPMAVMINPVYAYQKNDAVTAVNARTQPEDDNESTKPNAYQVFGYGDAKIDSLSKQVNYYSNKLHDLNNNSAIENLRQKAKGFSRPVPAFYNNDTLRHLMARIDQISKYFRTHNGRDVQLIRDSLGLEIGDYFKTPKFTVVNSTLQKKYHIDPAKNYNDDDAGYHQYHTELIKKMPAGIRADLQKLKTLSIQKRDQLQNPEYITYMKQLHPLLDSVQSYYKTPHVEQYSYASYQATMDVPADERRKAQDELVTDIQNPERKLALDKLNESGRQMRDYYQNTPAAKDREDTWKNELKTILGDDYNNIVHPAHDLGYLFAN